MVDSELRCARRAEHPFTVYSITRELVDCKPFDRPMEDDNARLVFHDGKQLKRGREHFTIISNRITFGEVRPFVDD